MLSSCGNVGHLKRDCFKLKNEKGKGIIAKSTKDFVAVANYNLDSVDYVLFVTKNLSLDGCIIMDFGCSFHVTSNNN